MKKLVYKVIGYTYVYNPETDSVEQTEILCPRTRTWSEANEEIAKVEAYNGEYTIEDDGQPETHQPTESERLDALETALLEMMGVMVDG